MALSYVTYTATGGTNYSVTFPYIAQADVAVYVDDVLQTEGAGNDYTWFNATTIQFTAGSTPSPGQIIRIRRTTQSTTRLVDFQDAGNLTEYDLDLSANQNFFLSQEAIDNFNDLSLQLTGLLTWDAQNHRLVNLADPVDAQDAVTKTWAETAMSSTLALAIVAQGLAEAAQSYAEEWAINPENVLVSVAAGGDGVGDYSALHWAAKAEGWATALNMPSMSGHALHFLRANAGETANEYYDLFGSYNTWTGQQNTTSVFRVRGANNAPTYFPGIELSYVTGSSMGYIDSVNRDTSTYTYFTMRFNTMALTVDGLYRVAYLSRYSAQFGNNGDGAFTIAIDAATGNGSSVELLENTSRKGQWYHNAVGNSLVWRKYLDTDPNTVVAQFYMEDTGTTTFQDNVNGHTFYFMDDAGTAKFRIHSNNGDPAQIHINGYNNAPSILFTSNWNNKAKLHFDYSSKAVSLLKYADSGGAAQGYLTLDDAGGATLNAISGQSVSLSINGGAVATASSGLLNVVGNITTSGSAAKLDMDASTGTNAATYYRENGLIKGILYAGAGGNAFSMTKYDDATGATVVSYITMYDTSLVMACNAGSTSSITLSSSDILVNAVGGSFRSNDTTSQWRLSGDVQVANYNASGVAYVTGGWASDANCSLYLRTRYSSGWNNVIICNYNSSTMQLANASYTYAGENQMHYHGRVASAGTSIRLPSGWSVTKTGTGLYTVTHNLGVTGMTVTAGLIGTADGTAVWNGSSVSVLYIRTYNTAGALADAAFAFQVSMD